MQVSSHTPSSKEKNDHSGVCRRVILLSSLPDLLEHKDANVKIDKTFFFFFPLDSAQLLKLPRASIALLR